MENATKALLIAGSVLIVLLLIAMGIKIFNSTSDTTQSADTTMKAANVSMFNTQVTKYFGNNISKTKVIDMINAVNAINKTNKNNVTIQFHYDNWGASGVDSNSMMDWVVNKDAATKYYDVWGGQPNDQGYINVIYIKSK